MSVATMSSKVVGHGRSRLAPVVRVAMAMLPLWSVACGGGSSSPTAPTRTVAPAPVFSVTVSPNPVQATVLSVGQSGTTYRVTVTATFTETAGGSGTVSRVTSVVQRSTGETSPGSLEVAVPFGARGTVVQSFTQDFVMTTTAAVSLRVSGSGVDSEGRPFDTAAATVDVDPPYTPPPPVQASSRIEMYGGSRYDQYLGCVTCGRYEVDSIHNQFGRYGSRFSSTSIWNPYSNYGSRYNTNGACNEYATNPPIWIQNGRVLGELTLNRFRSQAIRDSSIVAWLANSVCEQ